MPTVYAKSMYFIYKNEYNLMDKKKALKIFFYTYKTVLNYYF